MSSRRRNSKKNLGTNLSDIQRRLRRMERKPIRTRLQNRVIKGAAIAPSSITADEVGFGTAVVSSDPENDVLNPKDGLLVINPDDNAASIYSEEEGDYLEIKDVNAQASADGKNTIYRQTTQPTGGTYVTGDVWFDTDDDNKIYRYSSATSTWVGFTLGNNALASISANKITAGTIDASVITVSNLDAGNITTGTLTGRTISGGTITGATIQLAAGTLGGQFTLTNTLLYNSPSLTWGPTASPYFEIYQFAGGSGTIINADGPSNDGYLFINAAVKIEFQAPEMVSFYNITMPSAASGTNAGGAGIRNIYAYASLPNAASFDDGDIVIVY